MECLTSSCSQLKKITDTLEPLKTRNVANRMFTADKDAVLIQRYILQVDQALIDYQVRLKSYTMSTNH